MASLIGRYEHHSENIGRSMTNVTKNGFEFIVADMSHPRFTKSFIPFSDVFIQSSDRNKILANVPKRNYTIRSNLDLLEKELSYAGHIGLTMVVIECPLDRASIKAMADVINRGLHPLDLTSGQHITSIAIKVPIVPMATFTNKHRSNPELVDMDESWSRWNLVRSLCGHNARIMVALTLTGDLADEERIARWLGEPIALLFVPTSLFLTNPKQYPVLSRSHQCFLARLHQQTARRCSIVVEGNNQHSSLAYYHQYLAHLRNISAQELSGYEDVLQVPLQPLKNNLDSMVYEVFENDQIKYQQYELAMTQVFKSRDKTRLVVMVVGAGRGPLVEKALLAARKSGKQVNIYAVEKNANAIFTLQALNKVRWQRVPDGRVEIVAADMRTWEAPEKADVIVSELLGSFSDNELSPECLDGVWRYVHADTISIPCAYNSYIQPIQSQRLWSQIVYESPAGSESFYDWAYVVQGTNFYAIDEPTRVFSFQHQGRGLGLSPEWRDNARHASLDFKAKSKSMCHGFMGYFDCQLYNDVWLSIVPANKNTNMNSWFPIFFPVEAPFEVDKGASITLDMTRNVHQGRVWYEWTVMQPMLSKIHNPNGQTYSISLLT